MQLTRVTDYGRRVFLFMASLPINKMTTMTEMSKGYATSRYYRGTIVYKLSQEAFIHATRGKPGGVCLARPAKESNVGGIIRRLEPLKRIDGGYC